MFPYVRAHLAAFVADNWQSDFLSESIELLARDAGSPSAAVWFTAAAEDARQAQVVQFVEQLMDNDVKATGLKDLQGKIWKSGFESGALRAHVFADVRPAIESWRAAGLDVRIYSSGSIAAQKLFFAHSIVGDMLPLFSGHYDTTIGGKKDPASYQAIAADWQIPAAEILFVSDVLAELDAAHDVGMPTALSIRAGNPASDGSHQHPAITSFAEIKLS
jgi:enolase-phosphatase E1